MLVGMGDLPSVAGEALVVLDLPVTVGSTSPSAEDRLPKSFHFAESNLIIGVVRARSVHEVGYGHKWHWEAYAVDLTPIAPAMSW